MSQNNQSISRIKNKQFSDIPTCTCGAIFITVLVLTGSLLVLISDKYTESMNDGQKVFDQQQYYRLFTSMFSIISFIQLGIMISCFIWLPFIIMDFQKKYGTVYTIYHFFRTHILIGLLVDGIFEILFILTTLKNFIQVSAGILPYCLFMYLKLALINPTQQVDYWFMPIKMKRWIVSLLVGLSLMLCTQQSQGCMVVNILYIFNLIGCSLLYLMRCRSRVTSKNGPLMNFPFKIIQKLIPGCIKDRSNFYLIGRQDQDDQIQVQDTKNQIQNQVQLN